MSLLVNLKKNKSASGYKFPLIFVSDIMGHTAPFFNLAIAYEGLDPNRPLYALRSPFLADDLKDLPTSIEELAECYADELIKKVDRPGYSLCGYSFGGIAAYALAHELLKRGKQVRFFSCIDTDFDKHLAFVNQSESAKHILDIAQILLQRLKIFNYQLPTVETLSKQPKETQISSLFNDITDHCLEQYYNHIARDEKLIQINTLLNNLLISCNYRPKTPLPIVITVYSAAQTKHKNAHLGWENFSQQKINVETIPADHFSILDNEHLYFRLLSDAQAHEIFTAVPTVKKNFQIQIYELDSAMKYLYNNAIKNGDLEPETLNTEIRQMRQDFEKLQETAANYLSSYIKFSKSLLETNQILLKNTETTDQEKYEDADLSLS